MPDVEPYNGGYLKVNLIGPFEYHAVVVDGRRVPFLTARPANGGKVWVSLEGFARSTCRCRTMSG